MRALLAFLLLVLATPALARPEPFDPLGKAGIGAADPHGVPLDRPFVDEAGRPVTLRALASGRPMLLVPVQHDCPTLCGLTLAGLVQAARGQADVAVIALGIDPREGPAEAAKSMARLAALPGAHALTGREADIRAVTKALGYRYAWDPATRQYAHIAATAAIAADGRLSGWLYGVAPKPDAVRAAVAAARQDRSGSFGERVRLLCYHLGALTGRYSGAALAALRWAAGLAAVALLGGVGWAFIRERRRAAP